MDRKLIIGLLIAAALLVGIWIGGSFKKGEPLTLLPKEDVKITPGEAGYGWSIKDDTKEAVKEAMAMMREKLGGSCPQYVLLWYTIGYDYQEIQDTLRNLLPSDVQIQGNSSAVGVISPDGYHVGEVGSIAVMGIASDKVKIGVGSGDLDELEPEEAGEAAIREAMANAGRTELPQFVYITGAPGKEEAILKGIEKVIGAEVPIIGGSGGDETLSGRWSQIGNGNVYTNGIVLGAVYTDLRIGKAHEFGYMRSIKKGIVTKAEGRTLYEIDNRPAAEIYNEWTGGHFNRELAEGGSILAKATFYPLARLMKGREISHLCVSHPGIINLPEKSITMFTDIEESDEVVLLHGNWEWLVNRAQSTARQAMFSENILSGEGLFAFYTFCAGTLLAIPESERSKIPILLRAELGDIPFIGGFTLGEQTFMAGIGNRHANLVNSIAIFK